MSHWLQRIGQSDADTFASIIAKLGNNTTAFWAAVGYEGATALAAKLTAARAALLDQITALRMAELDAANLPADIDTLLARLTALRAGYLDNLSAGATSLRASQLRELYGMDFWSNPQEEVSVPAVAGTLTLPSVTVADLPAGVTVVRAVALLKFRVVENTNVAANKLDGATVAATSQVIQVRSDAPGTWRDAINFVDDQFGVAASIREGGDALVGSVDIAVEVIGNDTYEFRWLLAKADVASLNLNDCACGLRVWFSV